MPRPNRLTVAGLALAMTASAAFLLWTTGGFTFFNDEIGWYVTAPRDYDPAGLLRPHNTHLIALPRLVYATSLHVFGPSYLPFRVIAVIGLLLCAGLFFALARRRIGALALAPTVVLLFLGTAWNVVVSPIGIPFLLATATGLGALLALERGGRGGDVGACLLLVASLASHSIGLSFLAGVAASVLLRPDRVRRLWVFGVPLVLYVAWWLLAARGTRNAQSLAEPTNVLGLPWFVFQSAGAVLASLTGLNLALGPAADGGFNRPPGFNWVLVPVLALAGLVVLAVRLRRGRLDPSFWVFATVLLAFWISIGLSAGAGRQPTTPRYLFPGAVMLLLVAAEAARGARWRRPATVALVAVTAFALAVNVVHVQHAKRFLLAYSANVRPTLAMVELAGPAAKPRFRPATDAPRASPHHIGVSASTYLLGAAKWGSIAAPLGDVRRAPPVVRNRADVVLARALGAGPVPATTRTAARGCATVRATDVTGPTTVRLPRGGAILRSTAGAEVSLRRFGPSFAVRVGALRPGSPMTLELAPDRAPDPWYASVSAASVVVCPVPRRATSPARFCEIQQRLRVLGARRPEEARTLLAELRRIAPPAIRRDLLTVLEGALAGGESSATVRSAQRRIDAFTARTCRR